MYSTMTNELPSFIRVELEDLFKKISPLVKKNTRYVMFSIPIIIVSVLQLIFFLFTNSYTSNTLMLSSVYALMAAIGFALYHESKFIKRKMRSIQNLHIIERIKHSKYANDYQKDVYIKLIESQPNLSLQHFMRFLTEENQRKKIV
ncbi:DUF5392 family protein [Saliterribacillus persicus]|uniref:Uncharacterized protein n=1 Tax=Saliterribacillus persicus TaxID=930114 RepID=A0A368Y9I9_9BACI|nr:DUF5392 family protein [Saliterribacillus persicus]RCW74854.1 hypothetical protein DFR57_103150 [Saliterribacillus persicus]